MPQFNKQISSLIGGVSQQPDSVRFDNQAKEQINFYSSSAIGLVKRYPSDFISELPSDIPEDAHFHFVDRDLDEKYFLVIYDGNVRAFDLSGQELTVNNNILSTYLSVPVDKTPKDIFRTLTLSDTTILVNTTETVGPMVNPLVTDFRGLIYVRQGNFGKTYTVLLGELSGGGVTEVQGTYTVPDGDQASDAQDADTSNIAAQLAADLQANIGTTGFVFEQKGNIIYIYNTTDWIVGTSDGFDDRAMYPIKGEIELFSDLPRKGPRNVYVKITGSVEGNVSASDYWVKSVRTASDQDLSVDFGAVVWEETIAPGATQDLSTGLPIKIVRESNGDITVDEIEFNSRTVGDEDSAKQPDFVGNKINSVFFWKNRLGFLSGESFNISESGDFFNFFPNSVATLLPADPIINRVNDKQASTLKHAVPWQEQVIFTSDKSQYVLRSQGSLTGETISVTPATNFSVNTQQPPIVSGSAVYFSHNEGQFTEIREYFVDSITSINDAANITAHIPTYIPKDTRLLRASRNAKNIVFVSDSEPDTLYVYQYLWNGNQKIQSSWHKYKLANEAEIADAEFIEDKLYLFIKNINGNLNLLSTELTDSRVENNGNFVIHLDNRITSDNPLVSSVDNGDGTVTYTLPSAAADEDNLKAINYQSDTNRYGNESRITDINGNQVTVQLKNPSDLLIFGNTFNSQYDFGTISIKEQSNLSSTAGRTNILAMLVNFTDTVLFKVRYSIRGRTTKESSFNGRSNGSIQSVFGKINPVTDVFRAPINAKNDSVDISIINDSHLPSSFQFVDVILRYWSTQGRRVS